jgi:hypothetical protein
MDGYVFVMVRVQKRQVNTMTVLSILGMLGSGYLFYTDHVIEGIFMFLASWVAWSFSDD